MRRDDKKEGKKNYLTLALYRHSRKTRCTAGFSRKIDNNDFLIEKVGVFRYRRQIELLNSRLFFFSFLLVSSTTLNEFFRREHMSVCVRPRACFLPFTTLHLLVDPRDCEKQQGTGVRESRQLFFSQT